MFHLPVTSGSYYNGLLYCVSVIRVDKANIPPWVLSLTMRDYKMTCSRFHIFKYAGIVIFFPSHTVDWIKIPKALLRFLQGSEMEFVLPPPHLMFFFFLIVKLSWVLFLYL